VLRCTIVVELAKFFKNEKVIKILSFVNILLCVVPINISNSYNRASNESKIAGIEAATTKITTKHQTVRRKIANKKLENEEGEQILEGKNK
jgi:hypothetical protein